MSKLIIDLEAHTLLLGQQEMELYSEEGFKALSKLWLKVGWQLHYHYTFTWLGIPCLQLPEDLLRLQELIVKLKPSWIIECGMAMGGTTLFLASICQLQGKGRVIGVEKDFRPHNKERLFSHPASERIDFVCGDSTSEEALNLVKSKICDGETVIVLLDSNHSYDHVIKELELYAPLVSKGSYLIVADGLKEDLHDVPRGKEAWKEDNPKKAAADFLISHPEFILKEPPKKYDKGKMQYTASHFEGGWLFKAK